MSFLTAGSGHKRRKTNNIASQSEPTKQRRSFETGGYKFNNKSYLVDSKRKCVNKMRLSVFIKGSKQKPLIFFIIIECSTQSSSSLLFS